MLTKQLDYILNEKLVIGYWAAQEQYSPTDLIDHARAAEKAGFETVFTSDHFTPWFDTGAHAGFAWAWMAACAAMTKTMRFGTGVTAPDRYHPALIAQNFATLGEMFPGRVMLGLGAGEAMNSIPLGIVFPSPGQRTRRLREALEIITRLWNGQFEDYSGLFYQLHNAKLYTKPKTKIPILVAAGGKYSAELAGEFGDGIIGFSGEEDVLRTALDTARKHGKDPDQFQRLIEFKCSYDPDYEKALGSVRIWRSTMAGNVLGSDISDPVKLEEKGAKEVTDAKIQEVWSIVTDVEELIKPIEATMKRGYNLIQIHSSSPDELAFIREFAEEVIPSLEHLQRSQASSERTAR
jgi:coenzyme F420-dependent glucose-6-phosphate dehydrogenase